MLLRRRLLSSSALTWDALLVGGGPTGAALACALATHPLTRHLRVALLDAQPYRSSAPGALSASAPPDPRVLALSHASSMLLRSCGVWDAVLATGRATPYYDMHVCDSAGGSIRFHASDAQLPCLGFIVEHGVLCDALYVARGGASNERAANVAGMARRYARMAELGVTLLPPQPFDEKTAPAHRLLLGCDGEGRSRGAAAHTQLTRRSRRRGQRRAPPAWRAVVWLGLSPAGHCDGRSHCRPIVYRVQRDTALHSGRRMRGVATICGWLSVSCVSEQLTCICICGGFL